MSKAAQEVILIWLAIIVFCAVIGHFQERDEKAQNEALAMEIARLKSPLNRTCIYKHGAQEIHYLNCKIVDEKYAVLN